VKRALAIAIVLSACGAPSEPVEAPADDGASAQEREPSGLGAMFHASSGGSDADRDGIDDANDTCPNVPEDRDGQEDDDGCPEGDAGDRDGDGIGDGDDACPDDPEDRDGFQDDDGCPDPDNDADGIRDVDDRCPNHPEDRDGVEDLDGCPET
jgi:hypothetical protein